MTPQQKLDAAEDLRAVWIEKHPFTIEAVDKVNACRADLERFDPEFGRNASEFLERAGAERQGLQNDLDTAERDLAETRRRLSEQYDREVEIERLRASPQVQNRTRGLVSVAAAIGSFRGGRGDRIP